MRIVTRGDMDGLTGSVIVSVNEPVDEIKLIHPQDITEGRTAIHSDDVLINVPYHPDCGLWFDHHEHTATYPKPPKKFKGSYGLTPSAARLVYEYYGGSKAMPEFEKLVAETDRFDSADLRPGDVITPNDYIQLGFTIDSRTGMVLGTATGDCHLDGLTSWVFTEDRRAVLASQAPPKALGLLQAQVAKLLDLTARQAAGADPPASPARRS